MANIRRITDLADPLIDDYRNLKESRLREEGGRFVAESEPVVRRLLESKLPVHSILATAAHAEALEKCAAGEFPIYAAAQDVLDKIAGFHVHRGCLAIGSPPPDARIPEGARAVVVLEDLADVDNVGAMVRNAAALGADAIILSPRCADPFYRKAIRVSMGSVFFLPIVRCRRWPGDLDFLRKEHGLALLGAVLSDGATPLARVVPPPRFALLLGSEGPGLTPAAQNLCDQLITIPMNAPHADSLNVATAGAVLLHYLTGGGAMPRLRK